MRRHVFMEAKRRDEKSLTVRIASRYLVGADEQYLTARRIDEDERPDLNRRIAVREENIADRPRLGSRAEPREHATELSGGIRPLWRCRRLLAKIASREDWPQ